MPLRWILYGIGRNSLANALREGGCYFSNTCKRCILLSSCLYLFYAFLCCCFLRQYLLRRGADAFLARHTSRCRRTESTVSLERGVCSCAELQVFFCYWGWKEACQARRAISTTSRSEPSSSFFFLQGQAPKEIHAILAETLGKHALSYSTIKNRVAQFKRGDFSTCVAPRPGWPKTVTTPKIIDQIHELILEDRQICLNQ